MINRDEILQAIKPFVLKWIQQRTGAYDSGVVAVGGEDFRVRVTAADLTSDYLDDKLVAGTAITKTVLNPGVTETLEIAVNVSALDHGSIAGLGDDDHTQYLNLTRHAAIDHSGLVHDAVTVVDTTTIDFTLTGQQITAGVIPGGIKLDDLGTPDDNTDLNASASQHGLLPKLSNIATNYLTGSGTWATPDHGSIGGLGDDDHTQYFLVNGSRDMGGHIIPALTDAYDLGSSSRLWRKGWLSELDTVVFAENTIVLLGGWFWVTKDQGTLPTSVLAADTTIDFGKAMTEGDFVAMKSSLISEYIQVGTLTTGTIYNVTRDLDGSGANDWPAGAPFAVLGQTGNGRIEFNAYDTPRISILAQGATYNATTELLRIGDLNGSFGISTELYGLGIGDYAGGNFLRYDPTNDFKIQAGDGAVEISGTGIKITHGTASANAVSWYDGSSSVGALYGYHSTTPERIMGLVCRTPVGETEPAKVFLEAYGGGGGGTASMHLTSDEGLFIFLPTDISMKISSSIVVGQYGFDETEGSINYTGALISYKNSTSYTGYIFVPLTTPATSTAWDGDPHSTTAKTVIDLSAVFGIPSGVKAVLVRLVARDSGSAAGTGLFAALCPASSGLHVGVVRVDGNRNDSYTENTFPCPCDANGDIYFQCVASGTNTMDVLLQIWGYYI